MRSPGVRIETCALLGKGPCAGRSIAHACPDPQCGHEVVVCAAHNGDAWWLAIALAHHWNGTHAGQSLRREGN